MAQMKPWLDLNAHINKKILLRVEHNLLEMDRQTDSVGWGKGSGLCHVRMP